MYMHCQDKNKYFSEDEANETAEYQYKVNNIKLRPYKCKECNFWHLTKGLSVYYKIKKYFK